MSLQTKTAYKPVDLPQDSSILELPILKHFDKGSISFDPNKLRKGEGTLGLILWTLMLAGIGYGLWVYVLPAILLAIGQLAGVVITVLGVIFFFMMLPVILKWMRRMTRSAHKALIRHDPFAELEDQKQKMYDNKVRFKNAKVKIKSLRDTAQNEAIQAEKDAKDYQENILSLQKKATGLKTKMQALEAQLGPTKAKETDEYVQYESEAMRVLSDAQRIDNQLKQAKSFISKYGARGNVMAKLDRKLTMVETAMDIKIADFETSIDMLQKEYEFARNAKEATDAAKSALGFTHTWELDYALDVVTSTISMDIAMTQENLGDIDTLTTQYSVDSDELYSRLEVLADNIKSGSETVENASKYNNPNYTLTPEDKANSGGFGNLFN